MLALMAQKPLEKITIKELVEKAGINRSTFYAHYMDVNDLMEKIEKEMAGSISDEVLYSDDFEKGNLFHGAAFRQLIAYFRENRVFYRVYFSVYQDSRLINESALRMRQHFVEPRLARTKRFTQEEYAFQFEFCKAGFFGVIMKWLGGDCAEPDDSVINVLAKLCELCLGYDSN